MKKRYIVGGVVGVLVIAAAMGGGNQGTTSSSTGSEPEQTAAEIPPKAVTALEVERAYSNNEAAAQQEYGSQRLQVSATIKSIDLGIGDEPFLVLKGESFVGPQAQLTEEAQKKAASLSKGQKIVLICEGVSEAVGTPMFKDCSL